jgi:hypothetical protein
MSTGTIDACGVPRRVRRTDSRVYRTREVMSDRLARASAMGTSSMRLTVPYDLHVAIDVMYNSGMSNTATAQMTAPEFVASIAALCKPDEAALVLVYARDGLSFCIASEQTSRRTAGHLEADDEDTLLGVAVITADGTLVEYPVEG